MKAIVFGGSGFLGSHVADALSAAGYATTIFDRQPSPHLQTKQRFIKGDIGNRSAILKATKGQDVLYNCAGFSHLTAAMDHPIDTVEQNILGCVRLLDAARQARIKRFVFASSIYVYSQTGGFYRASKQACESYIEEFQTRFRLPYTVLRFGTLYGPRADARNSVYRYLYEALSKKKIVAEGTGDEIRDYIHVQDAARISVDILEKEYANQSVVIAGHHPMRYRDLLFMIREMLGGKVKIDFRPSSTNSSGHYNLTPYTFQPQIARKLVSSYYMDMGQGLLECLQDIHQRITPRR